MHPRSPTRITGSRAGRAARHPATLVVLGGFSPPPDLHAFPPAVPTTSPQPAADHPAALDPGGGLDLIGDIHGHAAALDRLLDALGYDRVDGIPRHPSRTAVFLGDYVDRGPEIRRTLETVRAMVDRGDAVALMGNHEYNAIAWFTPRPDKPDVPCRRHTPVRQALFAPTLDALGDETAAWIQWMRERPMWLESDRLRAVHAGWCDESATFLRNHLTRHEGRLTEPAMQATCEPGTPAFRAVERLLKGHEIALPEGVELTDPEGAPRRHIRAKWYESPIGRTYRDYAMTADDKFPDVKISPDARGADFVPYGREERPIFVGHYWMKGETPTRLANNVACLDWSVARGGPIVAYRFDGEAEVDNRRFVAVR